MPPSTATQRETLLLDALDRVQRHARVRASAPCPGSISRRRSAPMPWACAASTSAADVLLDRRGRAAGPRCSARPGRRRGPTPAKSPRLGQLAHLAAERLQLEQLGADVGVHALERQPVDRLDARDRLRQPAPSRSRTSNRPGRSRSSRASLRARPGSPARAPAEPTPARSASSPSSRSISSKLSTTISPTPRPAPCRARSRTWRCRGARSAPGESPPRAPGEARRPRPRRTTGPPARTARSTAVQGKALEANTTWKSSWPASRPACTNARARARRSSSATT